METRVNNNQPVWNVVITSSLYHDYVKSSLHQNDDLVQRNDYALILYVSRMVKYINDVT